jgi:hypothetical protein
MHPESFLNFNYLISVHLRVIFAMAGIGEASTVIGLLDNPSSFLDALNSTRKKNPNSIVVLSFCTLQAQRIEALQKEILHLPLLGHAKNASGAAAKIQDAQIDARLHVYGRDFIY